MTEYTSDEIIPSIESIFNKVNIGTFAHKALEHICGKECFIVITSI
mgnify:CR=1 FL=1